MAAAPWAGSAPIPWNDLHNFIGRSYAGPGDFATRHLWRWPWSGFSVSLYQAML